MLIHKIMSSYTGFGVSLFGGIYDIQEKLSKM